MAIEISPFQKFMVSGENALPVPRNKRAAIAQQSAVPSAAKTPINYLLKLCPKMLGQISSLPKRAAMLMQGVGGVNLNHISSF